MKSRFLLIPLGLLFASAASLSAEEKFLLNGGETIVFFGDSITQNGGYVNDFESYLLTRFPEKTFRVINHGISSETISGTSEEDHQPRRPWALPRFTRDVAAWKPDVIVACFGMNDGNYHPFDVGRFQKYQQGIRTLTERVRRETDARLILMTPPPYDPYRRRVSDPNATSFGYKFPAVDYDHTLAEYSQWLVSLRQEGQIVVDLHSAMNEHLKQRRKKLVSFSFSPDAVHPDPTGHWLMAHHLLNEINAPRIAADLSINLATGKVEGGAISQLKASNDAVSFQWKCPLPLPQDPAWDRTSIALEKVNERFNRYRLRITGLKAQKYRLQVNGQTIGECNAGELNEGLNLLKYAEFPPVKNSNELLNRIKERRTLVYRNWRSKIGRPLGRKSAEPNRDAQQLNEMIDKLRQPVTLQVRLEPVGNR